MGKHVTKAAGNVFAEARYQAATFNDRLFSREGASEELGIDRSRLARIELGSKNPFPDEVLMMADIYNAPELKSYYCKNMCPLGKDFPDVKLEALDRISIYEILGLNKVNTKLLQAIDGDHYELRLLQVAQEIGLQFKPEQLKEYYETFTCNTELLKQANRKATLHKIMKYITRESENYPIGESGECWRYSYMRYREREDPRIERKRNMAKDWLEYLKWCKELGYDLDDMFIYMPNNFKKKTDCSWYRYWPKPDMR